MEQYHSIKTEKAYSLEELYALLQEKGNFPYGEPKLDKVMGFRGIVFPGEDGFVNMAAVTKKKIDITQYKEKKGGLLKSMGLNALTGGYSSLLNLEGKKNAVVLRAIADEIQRVVTSEV